MDMSKAGFSLQNLLKLANERALELRNPQGGKLFSIALTWVAALGLVAIVTRLFVPLVVAVIVLLVLKYQFAVVRDAESVSSPEDIEPS